MYHHNTFDPISPYQHLIFIYHHNHNTNDPTLLYPQPMCTMYHHNTFDPISPYPQPILCTITTHCTNFPISTSYIYLHNTFDPIPQYPQPSCAITTHFWFTPHLKTLHRSAGGLWHTSAWHSPWSCVWSSPSAATPRSQDTHKVSAPYLSSDPPENCQLNVKKLPKTWPFFSKKLPKIVIFSTKLPMAILF